MPIPSPTTAADFAAWSQAHAAWFGAWSTLFAGLSALAAGAVTYVIGQKQISAVREQTRQAREEAKRAEARVEQLTLRRRAELLHSLSAEVGRTKMIANLQYDLAQKLWGGSNAEVAISISPQDSDFFRNSFQLVDARWLNTAVSDKELVSSAVWFSAVEFATAIDELNAQIDVKTYDAHLYGKELVAALRKVLERCAAAERAIGLEPSSND